MYSLRKHASNLHGLGRTVPTRLTLLTETFYSQMKAKDKKKLLECLNMEKYGISRFLSDFASDRDCPLFFKNPTDIPTGVSVALGCKDHFSYCLQTTLICYPNLFAQAYLSGLSPIKTDFHLLESAKPQQFI